jgi:hypothetical protein
MIWVPKPQIGVLKKVSEDAIDTGPVPREQEIDPQACFRPRIDSNEAPEFVVSSVHLHGMSVGIELADERVPVFLCRCREMKDKGFN